MGIILPQEIDQSTLPSNGCLYTIGKLYSIFTLLSVNNEININVKQAVITYSITIKALF